MGESAAQMTRMSSLQGSKLNNDLFYVIQFPGYLGVFASLSAT